ncbi:MAG: PIN domain-containing protein [Prevotella sp.]|nr:PIN domain-containing protein [Prevotella sp.]MBR6998301.1 PIN domain-containing protein [Prevotella sp.]
MKVFLDTNILLDIANNREFAHQGRFIYQLGVKGVIETFASFLTFANLNYILRDRKQFERYNLLRHLRQGLSVLPCDTQQLDMALAHEDVRDFEDLLQYQCALAAGCDVVVTNNVKDFREFCHLPLMSSRDFLLTYFYQQEKKDSL